MNIENNTALSLTSPEQALVASSAPVANTAAPSSASASSSENKSGLNDIKVETQSNGDNDIISAVLKPFRPKPRELTVSLDEQNRVIVKTNDGYTIQFDRENYAWTITRPDGKATRIWGDPHVTESDGDTWDFTEQSTFIFGNNKITVETAPWGENGATVTKAVTIYNGDSRVNVKDINFNDPLIEAWSKDALTQDPKLADGNRFRLNIEANSERWEEEQLR